MSTAAARRSGSTVWTSLVVNADAVLDIAEFVIRYNKRGGSRTARFPTPRSTWLARSGRTTQRRLNSASQPFATTAKTSP